MCYLCNLLPIAERADVVAFGLEIARGRFPFLQHRADLLADLRDSLLVLCLCRLLQLAELVRGLVQGVRELRVVRLRVLRGLQRLDVARGPIELLLQARQLRRQLAEVAGLLEVDRRECRLQLAPLTLQLLLVRRFREPVAAAAATAAGDR